MRLKCRSKTHVSGRPLRALTSGPRHVPFSEPPTHVQKLLVGEFFHLLKQLSVEFTRVELVQKVLSGVPCFHATQRGTPKTICFLLIPKELG